MRDVRHSSRSIVTLDRAQLVGLGFFAVLSGGLMFGLGYSAGKVPRAELPKTEPPVLSQIDAEHALRQKMKEDKVDYTYFKALVARDEAPKTPKPNDSAKQVATLDKPLAERPALEAPKPAVEPKPVTEKLAEKPIVERAEKTAEPKLPTELEAKEPTFASAMAPTSAVEPVPAKAASAAKAKAGEFSIQVSSFRSESEAENFTGRLLKKGVQAFVTPSQVQGKGTWYRVRVGHFNSKTAAEMYKQKLDHDNVPAWIVQAD